MTSRPTNLRLLSAVVLLLLTAGRLQAQTNSWIAPAGDKWETASNWSLDLAPTNTQSIFITNSNSKVVTVDSTTSGSFSNTMTVNELSVAGPDGATNALAVSGIGTNVPLTVLASLSVSNGGVLLISNAVVNVAGITNGTFSLGGAVVIQNGRLLVSNVLACGQNPGSPGAITVSGGTGSFSGTLCVGLNTNSTGSVWVSGGQLMLTNGPATVGFYGTGQMTVSSSSTLTSDWPMIVGLAAGSQGNVTLDSSTWIAGGHLVVGQDSGATSTVLITGGQLTQTNAFLTLVGGAGSGEIVWSNAAVTVGALEIGADPGSQGTLTVAGGTNQVQGGLSVGTGIGATGIVSMTGGLLIATNWPAMIAPYGCAVVSISNGNWLGNSMLLGSGSVLGNTNIVGTLARGTVNVNGGSLTLLSKLVIGTCVFSNSPTLSFGVGGVGSVNVTGGSLYVTNATHDAVIDVRNGQLNISGGLVQVDKLVITNRCGLFVRTSGTLVVGSIVLATNMDADGDGMLNGWEQAYGFDPLSASDANVDSDGDGLNNLQEFQAGTIPTNSASFFGVTAITAESNDLRVTWQTGAGKTNALERSAGAAGDYSNNFSAIRTVTNTAAGTTNYLDLGAATNAPASYYRIRLVP